MINVVWDKYLREEEEELHEKKTEEIQIKQDPEASTRSTLDVFPDSYTSKVMAIKAPFVFSLDLEVKENISLVGVQLVSRCSKNTTKR